MEMSLLSLPKNKMGKMQSTRHQRRTKKMEVSCRKHGFSLPLDKRRIKQADGSYAKYGTEELDTIHLYP